MTDSSDEKSAPSSSASASNSNSSDGIAAALLLGILFTVGFFLVQYPLGLSIILGLIASISGYYLAIWWSIDQPLAPPSSSGVASIRDQIIRVDHEVKLSPSKADPPKQTRPATMFEWVIRKDQTSSREDDE
ncbi:MAG: hypothetical protein ACRC8A_05375 [Microcoleaceae cyanobacterium]